MALHEEQIRQVGSGHTKSINGAAMGMILDNLQRYQYTYPIKSTTREMVCNGIDSISEKNIARKILTGEAKIEDFYEEREGEIYADSKFDFGYYDLNWLSEDDTVNIEYIVGGPTKKDRVIFTDNGVGLGGKRLEGYFQMGFSSKRLSKLPIGKWGIGAKSPLSVGVDFYTVESRYNGQLFRFNIYSHTFDSIVPRFNLETGKENPFIKFSEGKDDEYIVYYESTEKKNGVTVTIEAKKHHKKDYIEAVRSQLLYFQGLKLVVIDEDEQSYEILDYRADIIYEDDFIILSDNQYYTQPHLLLNKVNYGYINWQELELNSRTGNVGIKVAPEDIEVTPSREGVVWSEKTKQMVGKRFTNVQEIAVGLIQEELKEADFVKWMRKCYNLSGRFGSQNSIVNRLSKIVDLGGYKPAFSLNSKIKYNVESILKGMHVKHTYQESIIRISKTVTRVARKDVKKLDDSLQLPIYLVNFNGSTKLRTDKWLIHQHGPKGFVTITEPRTEEKMREMGYTEEDINWISKGREEVRELGYTISEVWDLIYNSSDVFNYEDIKVPDDFKTTEKEEDDEKKEEDKTEEDIKEEKVARQSEAERRKAEGKIVIQSPIMYTKPLTRSNKGDDTKEGLTGWVNIEHKIAEINNWDEEEIYYGHEPDDERLTLAAIITRDPSPINDFTGEVVRTHAKDISKWVELKWYRLNKDTISDLRVTVLSAHRMHHFFDNKEIKIIKLAQGNKKYVRDFKHITEFYVSVKNSVITMSNTLVKWNTARVIKNCLPNLLFLHNFGRFNQEMTELYHTLRLYSDTHYREVEALTSANRYSMQPEVYKDLILHLDNVALFQEQVLKNQGDTELISAIASDLFGNPQLKNGQAVDPYFKKQLDILLDYARQCGILLNHIPALTQDTDISEELEYEIKLYLISKGVPEYEKTMAAINPPPQEGYPLPPTDAEESPELGT